MRFGAHIYLWIDRWTDEKLWLIDNARGLGLEWLEIALGDDVAFDPKLTRQKAEEAGLELIVSPGGVWPMECDISLAEEDGRRRGLQWHMHALEIAAEVGATAYTGAIYGHPGHVEKHRPTEEEFSRAAEGLHILAERAASLGVQVCLEPMSHFRTNLVNRPEQLMRLIELADHSNLFVLLDTYHLVTEIWDYPAAVQTAAPRLWGLHACENDRGAPGQGLIPWADILGALSEIGFEGHVGFESYNSGQEGFAHLRGLFADPCPDGNRFVQQGLEFLTGLAAEERGQEALG